MKKQQKWELSRFTFCGLCHEHAVNSYRQACTMFCVDVATFPLIAQCHPVKG